MGNRDDLTALVEHRDGVMTGAPAEGSAHLRRLLKIKIGVTVGVDVVAQDSIERSVGKMRRIVDNRPKR